MRSRIENFPVAWFSTIMGLAGFAIAWQRAERTLALPFVLSPLLLALAATAFALLLVLYATKILRYRPAVLRELRHPIQLNFFPTFSISLVLLATAALELMPETARLVWMAGSALQLLLTLYVLGVWINHTHFEIHHLNPAWFIPAVGNILVPIAGATLGFKELSWFFFSIGLLFWLILLVMIHYRVIFHNPMPERLVPTYFILIAPPAVGFVAYVQMVGHFDAFARVLFYAALFLLLFLITQLGRFARLKFALSWWAYSFPLAALTIAALTAHRLTASGEFRLIALGLLTLLSGVILLLVVRTVVAIGRREICVQAE